VERKDVHAAVEARRELGAGYEDEVVDSLLAKIDERLADRQPPAAPPEPRHAGPLTPVVLGMFGCGVGATAIATIHGAAWLAAIVWIAIAYAAGQIARYR
jgi:hypothetical protein